MPDNSELIAECAAAQEINSSCLERQSKTTVVISDDHPLFRDAIRATLIASDCFEIVGEAQDGESSVHEALTKKPELLLLDFRLPDFSGIEVLRCLDEAGAATRVLFVTAGMDRLQTLEALQLGARGIMTKDAATAELLQKAIRCVLGGEYWIGRDVMADWLDYSRRKTSPAQRLSVREREIANQVLTGKTNREIAYQSVAYTFTPKNATNTALVTATVSVAGQQALETFPVQIVAAQNNNQNKQ